MFHVKHLLGSMVGATLPTYVTLGPVGDFSTLLCGNSFVNKFQKKKIHLLYKVTYCK